MEGELKEMKGELKRIERQLHSLELRTDASLKSNLATVTKIATECRRTIDWPARSSPSLSASPASSTFIDQLESRLGRAEQQLSSQSESNASLARIDRRVAALESKASANAGGGVNGHVSSEARTVSHRTELQLAKQMQQLAAKMQALESLQQTTSAAQQLQPTMSARSAASQRPTADGALHGQVDVDQAAATQLQLVRIIEQGRTVLRADLMEKIVAQVRTATRWSAGAPADRLCARRPLLSPYFHTPVIRGTPACTPARTPGATPWRSGHRLHVSRWEVDLKPVSFHHWTGHAH